MLIRLLIALLIAVLCASAAPARADAIHQAALMGDIAKIKSITTDNPSAVNQKDENGLTPLFWAVYAEQPDAALLLIDLKAKVNATDKSGQTPLHVAVAMDSRKMVEILVSKGADTKAANEDGVTPLSLAERLGKTPIVNLLRGVKDAPPASIPSLRMEIPEVAGASIESTKITLPMMARKPGAPETKAVSYSKTTVQGIPVNVITVNLDDARVSVEAAISQGGVGTDELFSSFVKRCAPTAAINGTFFSKSNLRPIGDIVVGGKLVHWGGMGTALCFTQDCRPAITGVERNKHIDWSDYNTVICCGPRLVAGGSVCVDPAAEGFSDPHVLGKSNRTGVGIASPNKLILANTGKAVTLTQWAGVMKALGCSDALNFDGGASMTMYYRGRTISQAGRKLTNMLLVHERALPSETAAVGK